MKIRNLILLIVILPGVRTGLAQDSKAPSPSNADCSTAKEISVMEIYRATEIPSGPGQVVEYSGEDPFSLYYFENEHNSAWYKFVIPSDGVLGFDIVPDSLKDDYDFILYKYQNGDFCKGVKEKTLNPVRTCISRNDKSIRSWTGLNAKEKDSFIHAGPGKSYAKEIQVKKGERYYLVLDNVYEGGAKHTIIFHYQVPAEYYGKIKQDSSYKPIKAKVRLIDNETGKVVATAETDPKTGDYELKTMVDISKKYDLVVTAEDHFIYYETVNPQFPGQRKKEFRAELSPLGLGKNFTLEGINFEPNVDILVPEAVPKATHLLEFMLENPDVRILIEGHTNCAGNMYGPTEKDQPLSEARAHKIYDILMDGGVHPSRLERKGFGCTRMIVPDARILADQKKNMRVEIKILSY